MFGVFLVQRIIRFEATEHFSRTRRPGSPAARDVGATLFARPSTRLHLGWEACANYCGAKARRGRLPPHQQEVTPPRPKLVCTRLPPPAGCMTVSPARRTCSSLSLIRRAVSESGHRPAVTSWPNRSMIRGGVSGWTNIAERGCCWPRCFVQS